MKMKKGNKIESIVHNSDKRTAIHFGSELEVR